MRNDSSTEQGYDVVVVGGGPAGLQAALTLGRMHRPTLVLDSGVYRNDPAEHMHNLVGFDGATPAEFRAAAHRDLAAYGTVEVRKVAASDIKGDAESGFRVELADGTVAWSRRVLLATGLRDTLPDVPGLAELFGTVAAHCPYCHGHEYAGTHVALLGPHAPALAQLMERIAPQRTVLTHGAELPAEMADLVARTGLGLRTEPVMRLERTESGARVHFATGEPMEIGGLLVGTAWEQAAPFAEQLGVELLGSGCVRVDVIGRTSVAGVSAAGDLAHTSDLPGPMGSVLTGAAAGQSAAAGLDRELAFGDAGLALPF